MEISRGVALAFGDDERISTCGRHLLFSDTGELSERRQFPPHLFEKACNRRGIPAVIVNGRIKQSKWLDKEGAARTRTSIVGNQVQFLDFKETGEAEAVKEEETTMEAEKEPAEVLF